MCELSSSVGEQMMAVKLGLLAGFTQWQLLMGSRAKSIQMRWHRSSQKNTIGNQECGTRFFWIFNPQFFIKAVVFIDG